MNIRLAWEDFCNKEYSDQLYVKLVCTFRKMSGEIRFKNNLKNVLLAKKE